MDVFLSVWHSLINGLSREVKQHCIIEWCCIIRTSLLQGTYIHVYWAWQTPENSSTTNRARNATQTFTAIIKVFWYLKLNLQLAFGLKHLVGFLCACYYLGKLLTRVNLTKINMRWSSFNRQPIALCSRCYYRSNVGIISY